ncbi:MAG: phosphodiester glycosidase family protein [Fimbriimonas sp.]|nr:phosphodiester glycosidase family protein [Fimbriimonas sp.]
MRLRWALGISAAMACVYGQAPKTQSWEKAVAPGLTYRMEVNTSIPMIVHALRMSPGATGIRAIPELAGHTMNEEGTVKGRLTPAQMAAQASATGAINGDFFSFTQGSPIGVTIREGEILDTPIRSRAAFAWGSRNSAVGFVVSSISVTPEDGSAIKVDALNQPCGPNQIVVFSQAEGIASNAVPNVSIVVALNDPKWTPSADLIGTVESTAPDVKEAKVADGKALIVAMGERIPALSNLKIGQKIRIQIQSTGFDWDKVDNVIGGGPILIKDGKVAIDAAKEGFPASFFAKRHPRTAIGRSADGDIWLVAVDGRQEISAGATLEEMAKVMVSLGCVDAINLDGGGSTCLNLLGVTVNRPSDGVERPVSDGVLVFSSKANPPAGDLKLVIVPKIDLSKGAEARVTLDGKPVPNVDVVWGAQGAGWIDQGGTIHPLELGKVKIKAAVYGRVLVAEPTIAEH